MTDEEILAEALKESEKTGYQQTAVDGSRVSFHLSDPDPDLPKLIREETLDNETLHKAVYLGWVLIKSDLATVDEILGDFGLIHELVHHGDEWVVENGTIAIGPSARTVEDTAKLAEELLARLPDSILSLRDKLNSILLRKDQEPRFINLNVEVTKDGVKLKEIIK